MGISNYPNGFQQGVSIRGVPIEVPNPGKVFWVNNSSVLAPGGVGGSDGNKGTYQKPFSTVDAAVGKCTANRGDVIYVMPGHVETIASGGGIVMDVAGITIVGLGRGTLQPRFDFTATASTVELSGDNIAVHNINFHANVSGVVIGLNVLAGATNSEIVGCTFDVEATTTDEFVIGINYGVGCNDFVVDGLKMDMGLGGAATGIKLVGATAGGNISNSRIVGDYSQACVAGITTLSTEIYIEDCFLVNGASGNIGAVEVVEMLTGTTGAIRRTHSMCNVATIAAHYVADTMAFFENYATEDVGQATGATLRTAATSVTASADD